MDNALTISQSSIYSALLKHGYSNFSLTILEYCSPEQCIQREDYYLSCLPHEYNILEKAGSRLGSKHYDETKQILSDVNKGEKNPMYGKNHTEETKTIMSDVHKKIENPGRFKTGDNNPNYGKKVEGSGRPSQVIEVSDIKNNTTTYYNSIHEATKALNLSSHKIISNYIIRNQQKPYKGRYTFKKV